MTRPRKSREGVTLLELLIVLALTALLAAALGFAFESVVTIQRAYEARQAKSDQTDAMERQITQLIQGARFSASTAALTTANAANAATTYFVATQDSGSTTSPGSNRITFTTTAPGVPMASLFSTDDFNTQQQEWGPVGGLAEVSLGTAPVGDAGSLTGLFERIQRPSDSDDTQGGTESVLDPDVTSIGFEFWDGLEWDSTWDTTTGTNSLPEAVQVSYTLAGDPPNMVHMFVVPIPASTTTPNNPVTGMGAAQ